MGTTYEARQIRVVDQAINERMADFEVFFPEELRIARLSLGRNLVQDLFQGRLTVMELARNRHNDCDL